jgi:polyphosphate glucokinase
MVFAVTGDTEATAPGPRTLAIDIGGTGTKLIVLDATGRPLAERLRRRTPRPAHPEAVLELLREMLKETIGFDRISVGFPGVVLHGVVRTAPNLAPPLWHGFDLQGAIEELTETPARVVNDADMQGYGVIRGEGVELVLTLGTGMGSALFTNGHLVPNLELGHHPFERGRTYEERVGRRALERIGKRRWRRRVLRALQQLERAWNYDLVHLGGGNVRHLSGDLPDNVRVFASVQGLAGGVRLWKDDPVPFDGALWPQAALLTGALLGGAPELGADPDGALPLPPSSD